MNPNPNPVLLRALVVAVAVLLVGGVVGAATVDGDDTAEVVQSAGAGDGPADGGSEVVADDAESGDDPVVERVGPAATATTAAPAATVAAPATTAPPASKDPGQPTQPKTGLYRYKTTENGEPGTTDVRIERDTAAADAFVYRAKDDDNETVLNVVWRADAIYITKQTFPFGGTNIECDWEPDLPELKRQLRAGTTWPTDSTCKMSFMGANATLHRTGSSKIVGARRVTVAGQALDTWLIEETAHIEIDGSYNGQQFHFTTDTAATGYFSPPHGMSVKSTERTTSTRGDGKAQDRRVERELTNLTPTA